MLLQHTLLALALFAGAASANDTPQVLQPFSGRVTYVDFWASWCAPCAQSIPWLNQMRTRYMRQGLRVVGVGLDADAENSARFLKQHPADFPIVEDAGGKLAERYAIEGMPYALLLDANGKVLFRHSGFRASNTDEYEQHIQAALAVNGALP